LAYLLTRFAVVTFSIDISRFTKWF